MPLHHIPNARTISLYVWHNTWAFVKKAGTIILLASAIVWLFAYLSDGDVQGSILARFGHWPCIATVTAIKQETGAWKWTIFNVNLLLVISFVAAVIIYHLARMLGWGG